MPVQGASPTQSEKLKDAFADFYDAEMQAAAEWVAKQGRAEKNADHCAPSRATSNPQGYPLPIPKQMQCKTSQHRQRSPMCPRTISFDFSHWL